MAERYLATWYDEAGEYPDDWHYWDWIRLQEGSMGKRRGIVYPGNREHRYRVELMQYDMTPEFVKNVFVDSKEEAIATVNRFLGLQN